MYPERGQGPHQTVASGGLSSEQRPSVAGSPGESGADRLSLKSPWLPPARCFPLTFVPWHLSPASRPKSQRCQGLGAHREHVQVKPLRLDAGAEGWGAPARSKAVPTETLVRDGGAAGAAGSALGPGSEPGLSQPPQTGFPPSVGAATTHPVGALRGQSSSRPCPGGGGGHQATGDPAPALHSLASHGLAWVLLGQKPAGRSGQSLTT